MREFGRRSSRNTGTIKLELLHETPSRTDVNFWDKIASPTTMNTFNIPNEIDGSLAGFVAKHKYVTS